MKQKLLALVFVLAFAFASFAALGAGSANAQITITTPGTTVDGPCAAITGFGTAIPAVLAHTDTPLVPGDVNC